AVIEAANAGGSSLSLANASPTCGSAGATNLNSGTEQNPTTMAARAPRAVMPVHHSERITVGQSVAAMPDQPKITNQNTVRSGVAIATPSAITSAANARPNVAMRLRPTSASSGVWGARTF